MERLTQNNFDYCLEMCEPECMHECPFYKDDQESKCHTAAMYDKLREYEDTGLEPEELLNLKSGVIPAHWGDLFRAECDGRLVVLPCKVGDTVYDIQDGHVLVLTVESIHMWSSGAIRISAHTDKTSMYWKSFELRPEGFGKVFFLNREEAEKALEVCENEPI